MHKKFCYLLAVPLLFIVSEVWALTYTTTWTIRNHTRVGAKYQFDIDLKFTGDATDFKVSDVTLGIDFNQAAIDNPVCVADGDGIAETDWWVKTGTYNHMWIKDSDIFVADLDTRLTVNTNILASNTYTNQGYTSARLPLLSSDPDSLHCRISFGIVNGALPFNVAWRSMQAITRKKTDGNGEDITSKATFEIEAEPPTPTKTPTPTGTPAGLRLEVKVYLEGPYDTGTELMTTTLQESSYIPATSPYADGRVVSSLPASPTPVVDWVYVQLRETATGGAVSERSALLRADGRVADDNGDPVVLMPYPSGGEGSYYIVVRHRNHLAIMSATSHPLDSSSSTQYDFTLSQDRAYGSDPMSDPMNELTAGLYGMVSGDVLSLGTVNADCRIEVWNNRGKEGYRADDCDMSAFNGAGDRIIIWNNRGRMTRVPL